MRSEQWPVASPYEHSVDGWVASQTRADWTQSQRPSRGPKKGNSADDARTCCPGTDNATRSQFTLGWLWGRRVVSGILGMALSTSTRSWSWGTRRGAPLTVSTCPAEMNARCPRPEYELETDR